MGYRRMNKITTSIFVILSLTLISPVYGQQKISDKDNTFNFIIPNDWEKYPLDDINQKIKEMKKLKKGGSKPSPVYFMGFRIKKESPDPFPFVLISEVYTHLTEQDISYIQQMDGQWAKDKLNEIYKNLGKFEAAPTIFYEKEKGFIWIFTRILNQVDLEDFHVLMVGVVVPTKKGQLLVSCHLKEANKKKYYTTCFNIIKSLNVSDDFIIRYK